VNANHGTAGHPGVTRHDTPARLALCEFLGRKAGIAALGQFNVAAVLRSGRDAAIQAPSVALCGVPQAVIGRDRTARGGVRIVSATVFRGSVSVPIEEWHLQVAASGHPATAWRHVIPPPARAVVLPVALAILFPDARAVRVTVARAAVALALVGNEVAVDVLTVAAGEELTAWAAQRATIEVAYVGNAVLVAVLFWLVAVAHHVVLLVHPIPAQVRIDVQEALAGRPDADTNRL
jgi:hypothetical protein